MAKIANENNSIFPKIHKVMDLLNELDLNIDFVNRKIVFTENSNPRNDEYFLVEAEDINQDLEQLPPSFEFKIRLSNSLD